MDLGQSAPDVAASTTRLRDSFDRAITDLRISVADRCNYKCVYCRTGNEGAQYTELPIADYLPPHGACPGVARYPKRSG